MTHPAAIVDGWLERVSYKPDTRMALSDVHPQGFADIYGVPIMIERQLPDSTKGTTNLADYADYVGFIPITARVVVPAYIVEKEDFDAFVYWLREELMWMEKHELGEWLRVDGELPFDPHKED